MTSSIQTIDNELRGYCKYVRDLQHMLRPHRSQCTRKTRPMVGKRTMEAILHMMGYRDPYILADMKCDTCIMNASSQKVLIEWVLHILSGTSPYDQFETLARLTGDMKCTHEHRILDETCYIIDILNHWIQHRPVRADSSDPFISESLRACIIHITETHVHVPVFEELVCSQLIQLLHRPQTFDPGMAIKLLQMISPSIEN